MTKKAKKSKKSTRARLQGARLRRWPTKKPKKPKMVERPANRLLYSQTHVEEFVRIYFSVVFGGLRSKEFSEPMRPGDILTMHMDKHYNLNIVKRTAEPDGLLNILGL